jgi:hypothetical protein
LEGFLVKKKSFFVIYIFQIFFITQCINYSEVEENGDYLVFGDFYGECVGEGCVDIYKIQNKKLYEDTLDFYPSYLELPHQTNYVQLSIQQYLLVKDITIYFPDSLLHENDVLIGQPDATDGGGFYIETNNDGTLRYWLIDKIKSNVPVYLHSFMDSLDNKLILLQKIF